MNDTLKECPFCGGAARRSMAQPKNGPTNYAIGCSQCIIQTEWTTTEAQAIAAGNARKSPRTEMGDEMSDFLAGHVTYTDEGEDSYWSAEIQQFGGDYLVATVYAHDEETVRWRQEAILTALRTGEATDV